MKEEKEMVKATVKVDGLSVDVQVPQEMMQQIQEASRKIQEDIKNLKTRYGLSTEQSLLLTLVTTYIEKSELEKQLEEYSQFIKSILGDIKNIIDD